MSAVYALLGALTLIAAWLVAAYVGLISARNRADAAWSAVDARLGYRHALACELVNALHHDGGHDPALIAEVVAARSRAIAADSPFERGDAERQLSASIDEILRALHDRADDDPLEMARVQLTRIEDDLQRARRIYNADVRLYLSRRGRMPCSLLVGLGDFVDRPYYELDRTRRRGVTLARR